MTNLHDHDIIISITAIGREGQAALVQWVDEQGALRRAHIPTTSVMTDAVGQTKALASELRLGIPYGIPWAQLIKPAVTSERIEQALHDVGIWTVKDLQANTQAAVGALQTAYGVDLGVLLNIAARSR